MDSGNVSAIISAAAGISGVLLGNAFVLIKEWIDKKGRTQQNKVYYSIIIVSHLERFVAACLEVARDDGTYQGKPAGENGVNESTVKIPEFRPLDLTIEWKTLPKGLMYSILRIPDLQEQIQGELNSIQEFVFDPPDFPEYFWTRRRSYALLGLQTSDIIKKVRKYSGLPAEEIEEGKWDRELSFRNIITWLDALGDKTGPR